MIQLIPDIIRAPILRLTTPTIKKMMTPRTPAIALQLEMLPAVVPIASAMFPAMLLLPSLIIPT